MDRALFWHQGLFLQPQHLQLNTRYLEQLNLPFKHYLQPYFWGVGSWQIQTGALANRSFQLTQGDFLFSDMAYAVVNKNALIIPRSFDGAWEDGQEGFGVYLGLRKFNNGGRNVTIVSDLGDLTDVNTRWVTSTAAEQVADLQRCW